MESSSASVVYKRDIYTLAAAQSDNSLVIFLWAVLIGATLGVSTSRIGSMYSTYTKTQKLERLMKDLSESAKENIETGHQISQTSNGKQMPTNNTKQIIKLGKNLRYKAIVLSIAVIFVYIIIQGFVLKPANLRNKFEQDITMIHPYVEERLVYQLQSDWVCMRSKNDYDRIYECIDNVKKDFSLPN